LLSLFVTVSPYMEIKDEGRVVLMSHYPMIVYKHDVNSNVYMLYGHVHSTHEFDAIKEAVKTMKAFYSDSDYSYQGNLFYCWCGFSDYAPATLDEIINNRLTH